MISTIKSESIGVTYMTDILEFDLVNKGRIRNPKILLDSGPPKALYKVTPRLIFGKKWWDEARKEAYKSYGNSCAACGADRVALEAHEMYKIDKKLGKIYLKDIVPLCPDCHSFVHQDLHRGLLRQGVLKNSDVLRILNHGKAVLRRAKLRYSKADPNDSKIKDEDWRLVINGNEYGPIPKEEWNATK